MRRAAISLAFLLAFSGCLDATSAPDAPAAGQPFSFVVHGDSFTAALDMGRGDRSEISWATGTEPGMASILQRLEETRPEVVASNVAFSGARMKDVPQQASQGPLGADLVLVWLGINDMCMEPSVSSFRSDAAAAFDLLGARHPDARIVVFAVPDLWRLHELHLGEPQALALWGQAFGYCAEFFNPGPSPTAPIVAYARLDAFNGVLREEAVARGFDYSDATVWPGWGLDDFSAVDYFHPVLSGESRLAAAAWPAVTA